MLEEGAGAGPPGVGEEANGDRSIEPDLGTGALVQPGGRGRVIRPDDHQRLADDVADRGGAPEARIVGVVAVVTEDEEFTGGDPADGHIVMMKRERAREVGGVAVDGIRLALRNAVDVDDRVADLDGVTPDGDHARLVHAIAEPGMAVRTGETVDILLEVTNPGVWMAHCHIAEHHESGMMFSFTVDP